MSKLLDILDPFLTFLAGLTPGALGAAVSLAHEKGLTWSERCIQFAAGTTVSWFAQRGIGAVYAFDPFVLQGIGFSAGMVAFKSTPRFIASAADVAGSLPALLRDRFFPARKDKP
nr:hypothetical protein [uncultured Sphingomonas sp.]